MHDSEVNRIKREIRQLVHAAKDMQEVREAAETLSTLEGVPCAGIMVTGMVVTYCRGYTLVDGRRVPVTATMLPEGDALKAHVELFKLRDTVNAHSDETPNRVVADPFGEHRYTEAYHPWKPESFAQVVDLARSQEERFRTELRRREGELRVAGVPASTAPW